ncbi:MAG: NAD(P)-binding domain-containing protein [Bacteroidetes bacterium]|nr:NAD(P)-binding domain-containing protein [Bacteroidota bacterium]
MIKTIGIVGNGSFGTAITKVLTDNGNDVYWWLRNEATAKYIRERNHNSQYLQSVSFRPGSIEPTTDIHRLVSVCDTIVFAVPSAYAMQVLQQVSGEQWRKLHVISAIKGIIPETRQLLCDYLHEEHGFSLDQYVAITGPCHAEEVAAERLSYLTFSGLNQDFASEVAGLFQNEYIRTSFNHDIWGAQYAAVLKNIYAIGAGMAHALDYGDNFLSVFITACYRELWHFLNDHFHKIHPSNEVPDFHTSAYLGDLLVTGYSLHSRNRAFGSMIGKGYSVKSATLEMNMVAEGYYASRGMQTIAKQFQIELPIANMIYLILWEGLSAQVGFKDIEAKLS